MRKKHIEIECSVLSQDYVLVRERHINSEGTKEIEILRCRVKEKYKKGEKDIRKYNKHTHFEIIYTHKSNSK